MRGEGGHVSVGWSRAGVRGGVWGDGRAQNASGRGMLQYKRLNYEASAGGVRCAHGLVLTQQ